MISNKTHFARLTTALLAATALAGIAASPAFAATKKKATTSSQSDLRSVVEQQQKQIDALTAQINQMRANAAPVVGTLAGGVVANAQATDENASKLEFMEASAEAQQAQIDSLKKQVAANAPAFKAAPEFKGSGFSFKPSGELQFDFGYVSNPNNAINTSNLGWNGIARRLLLGASGTIPGGFKYKAEFNFAGSAVSYEDVIFSYSPTGSPLEVIVGYMYPFSSMENMESNKNLSFVERAAFDDAWGNGRRLGGAVTYTTADWLIQTGVFNGQMNGNSNNTDYSLAARGAFYPMALGGQLHFGASYEYRQFLKSAQGNLYQARPFTQTTNIRFVGTGPQTTTGAIASGIAASGDQIIGLEAAGIWGPFHVTSEAQWLKVRAINPTDVLTGGNVSSGQRLASDPTFFSVYGEVGYWLTGETRGYSKGTWATTKILNPFDKGGWGGFQVVGRVDYLNLNSYVGGVSTGAVVNGELNGGKQTGYQMALNWWPTEYVRFTAQYDRVQVTGGPSAGQVVPTATTTDPLTDRSYGLNVVTMRAQLAF